MNTIKNRDPDTDYPTAVVACDCMSIQFCIEPGCTSVAMPDGFGASGGHCEGCGALLKAHAHTMTKRYTIAGVVYLGRLTKPLRIEYIEPDPVASLLASLLESSRRLSG